MPKGVKRIGNNEPSSKLAVLLDSLISLDDSDFARLVESANAGRKLRFELEALRAKLG